MSDFRRRKWRPKGSTNSVPQLSVVPRISMITALDSMGRVYISLLQSNSNSKIMEIYFHALTKKLESENPNFRRNTVFMLDNGKSSISFVNPLFFLARYHTSKSTLQLFENLQLPVLFTGPHSYDAAPCELWFAAFKNADINPRHVPLGKS